MRIDISLCRDIALPHIKFETKHVADAENDACLDVYNNIVIVKWNVVTLIIC